MFIKLNGKEYELKFTYRAIRNLEKYYGRGISKISAEIDMESIDALTVFIWAMLKRENDWQSKTVDDVAEALDNAIESGELELSKIGDVLNNAVNESMVVKQMGKSGNGKKGKGK